MSKTKVVFRKDKKDPTEIIALFPEEPADYTGNECLAYAHIGQHFAANYRLAISTTEPANEKEFLNLQKELEDIGYNLEIRQKFYNGRGKSPYTVRIEKIKSIMDNNSL